MVTFDELKPCCLCGISTSNKSFSISNRNYTVCSKCISIIEHVVNELLKKK
jgi:uncharacterized membrane protein